MKGIALLLLALASPLARADTPAGQPASPADGGTAVNTSSSHLVLALDRILPGATEDRLKALLPDETRAVLDLYLAGRIHEWYFRQDRPGAVFLIEADSVEAARALLAGLPLSKAGLIDYDLVPVGPYIPLATLLRQDNARPGRKKAH